MPILFLSLSASLLGCAKKTPQPELTPPVARTAPPPEAPPPVEPEARPEAGAEEASRKLSLRKALEAARRIVYFDFNQDTVREDSKATLQEIARLLKELEEVKLVIEGHCDERGSEEYNLHLGERRARAVERYLRTLGVEEAQLSTISYGETKPVDESGTEDGYTRNRRAELAPSS